MTAPHDTPEAVMHLVGMLPDWRSEETPEALDAALVEAAAMLRRLHARAVAAEDQASRAISAAENWHHEARRTREALAAMEKQE